MNYPYKCPRCEANFTVEMSIEVYDKLRNKITCPVCNNRPAKRDFHLVPVHFVGEGFTKSIKSEE